MWVGWASDWVRGRVIGRRNEDRGFRALFDADRRDSCGSLAGGWLVLKSGDLWGECGVDCGVELEAALGRLVLDDFECID